MNKIKVTALQRANLIDAMSNMWPSVPEANVIPGLELWRGGEETSRDKPGCGTTACFGGWAEWWPPFREQWDVAPNESVSWRTIVYLFGSPDICELDGLLSPRGGHVADAGFKGTDHALVTNRLQWLLDNSEVQE
jgi:hypothetical protein